MVSGNYFVIILAGMVVGETAGIGERKKKPINIKHFGGAPPGLCPVCPVDMSHLSRHLSRLSRGHSAPLNVNFHINRPKRPGCPWGVPNLSPGHSRGIPTTKFLHVIFLYRFFVRHRHVHAIGTTFMLGQACLRALFRDGFSTPLVAPHWFAAAR